MRNLFAILLALAAGPLLAAEPDPLDLASLRGRVVYVDFWASWCGPCRESFPWMNSMVTNHDKEGLTVIGVNVDQDPAKAQVFLKDIPARFRIVPDAQGKLAELYQLRGMPSSFVVDRKGKVRFAHVGFNSDKRALYEQEIQQLLKE